MSDDPRRLIDDAPMSRFQVVAVALTIALNALDGFDVLSISFASPGIAREWGIDRAALGIVLSMELIGMAVGSVLIGGVADRIGRRPTILGCLAAMGVGMLLCTTAHDVVTLCVYRVATGLGIGGMLAATNAMTAEYSSARRRSLCISLMAIGYPLGAVVGGSIAAMLLRHHDWRAVFLFGGCVSLALIPLILWRLPESIAFLIQKRPARALERVNAILKRMGHAAAATLPAATREEARRGTADIFSPALRALTIALTLAYFLHVATFYFILKWVPKIVSDMGFEPSSAAGVLVWANVGGAAGGALFGLAAGRIGLRPLTIGVLLASAALVTAFGTLGAEGGLARLGLIAAVAGMCTNAGIVGLYALVARGFPTHVRATGTGFVIGVGRGGSALSPILAGYLFNAGLPLGAVATVMAAGSLLAAGALLARGLRAHQLSPSR